MNIYTCSNLGVYFDGGIKIVLCMLTRGAGENILPCLESVAKYIDYWVIHETISNNPRCPPSQETILKFFRDHQISGEYHSHPIHHPYHFGDAWTNVYNHAKGKGDYLLLMESKEILEVKDPQFKRKLTADAYLIRGEHNYDLLQLLHCRKKWTFMGCYSYFILCDSNKYISKFTNMLAIRT